MSEQLPSYDRDHYRILSDVGRQCIDDVGVDLVTIVVATGRRTWVPAYSSSVRAGELEQYAFTVGEGPCFDALRGHGAVVADDLSDASAVRRWPAWTRNARALGVGSVTALPVRAGAISAGALTLYCDSVGPLSRPQMTTALRMADLAFLGLLDVMAGLTEADTGERNLAVLLRADVHRAAGMVMAQANISIDQALVRLRAAAFSAERSITDVAADVLDRRLRFDSTDSTE